MDSLYLDILDKKRQEILGRLSKILKDGYYLAGGTALALQINHRESFDFDLFKNSQVKFSVKQKIIKEFNDCKIQTLVDTSDELTLVLDNGIKITLLNYYWDPIFPLIKFKGFVPLLSIKDISATKAYALGRRGNYRDYFDLYVILKNKLAGLKDIVKYCQKKYGDIFSERMFLEHVTYTGDIDEGVKLRFVSEKKVSPQKITAFFREQILKSGL